jgi:hypothetical protein
LLYDAGDEACFYSSTPSLWFRRFLLRSSRVDSSGSSSSDSVSPLPEEEARQSKTKHSQTKVKLDDRPDPEAPEGRCLFQYGEITVLVGDVDQIAPGNRPHAEEYCLSYVVLEALWEARYDGGGCDVRMQSVDEGGKDWEQGKSGQGQQVGRENMAREETDIPIRACKALWMILNHSTSMAYCCCTSTSKVKCSMASDTE